MTFLRRMILGDMILLRRVILTTVCIAVIPLLSIAGARIFLDIKMTDMTRDVAAIAGVHPLSGALSSLGILLWWTSASIWLFTALLRRRMEDAASIGFQVCAGLLSIYLALDDLFQFHEHLAPTYLHMSERAVYGLISLGTVMFFWRYRQLFNRPEGVLMLLALGSLSTSVVIDDILEPWLWRLGDWEYLVEDGLKWLGICFWTTFCIVRCANDLKLMPALKSN